jgi:sec-independent protein translocase protein TatB
MFDIASTELLLIVVVAVIVIGPKDLPRALYKLGQVVGKARGMARHFRTGIDAMVREAELEELQKQWAKQNEEIMARSRTLGSDGTLSPATPDAGAFDTAEYGADPSTTSAETVVAADQVSSAPAASPAVVGQGDALAQQSLDLGTNDETAGSRST